MDFPIVPNGPRRISMRVAVMLFAVVGLVAYFFYPTSSSSPSAPPVKPVDDSSFRTQSVEWAPCAEDLFMDKDQFDPNFVKADVVCATIKVPASYDQNYGKDLAPINVEVMKQPAKDQANKLGSLFFNPGGPGESGIEEIQWIALDKKLRANYDIIGFDPRGVGASSPIRCSDKMDLESYFTGYMTPENETEAKVNDKFNDAYMQDCLKNNPTWWTTNTANTVHDMDILRQVITGDQSLNFLGSSYGTTLAAQYITAYPENTGRIVLDSPTSNEGGNYANDVVDAKAQYDSFARLFDKCAEDPDCPGATRQEVEDFLITERNLGEHGKLAGFAGIKDSTEYPGNKVSSEYLIYEGISALAYWPIDDAYPEFKSAMNELQTGWNAAFEYYGLSLDGYDPNTMKRNNSYEILQIVNCLDSDGRDHHTAEERKAQEDALAKANPFSHRFFESDTGYESVDSTPGCDWTWAADEDPAIPDPPQAMPSISNDSGKQFLLIGSKGDNATPYEFAQRTAASLKSVLLTYEGTGHAIAYNGYACVDDKITNYLLTGELPAEGTSCAAE